jgi:hypothetical protein
MSYVPARDILTLTGKPLKNQLIEASIVASHSNEMLLPTTAETFEVLLMLTENVSFIAVLGVSEHID